MSSILLLAKDISAYHQHTFVADSLKGNLAGHLHTKKKKKRNGPRIVPWEMPQVLMIYHLNRSHLQSIFGYDKSLLTLIYRNSSKYEDEEDV